MTTGLPAKEVMFPATEDPVLDQSLLLWDWEVFPAVGAGLELSDSPVYVAGAVASGRADAYVAGHAKRLDNIPVFRCVRWVTKVVVLVWALVCVVVYTLTRRRHHPTPDSIGHGVHRMPRGPILWRYSEFAALGRRELRSVFRGLRYATERSSLLRCLRSPAQRRGDFRSVFWCLRLTHTSTYYLTKGI